MRGPIVTAPAFRDPVDVAYTLMPCERCGATIAMLAHSEIGTLEDTARAMFEKIRELNVPAWIAGVPGGEGPVEERPADLLKVWPEREEIQRLAPESFDAILDALGAQHCHSTRLRIMEGREFLSESLHEYSVRQLFKHNWVVHVSGG